MEKEEIPELESQGFGVMLRLLGRHLGRNLVTLFVPVGLVMAASMALCGAIALRTVSDGALIVDDRLALFEPSWEPVILAAVMALALLAVQLVLVAMVVVIVAGSVLGKPVSVGRALRMVLRRSAALVVLWFFFVVISAVLLLVAGFLRAGSEWPGTIVTGLISLVLWRLPLTVPLVMLKGAGPFKAFAGLWALTDHRRLRVFVRLMATVVVLPIIPGACASWLVSQFTGIEHSVAQLVAAAVIGALSTVLQGAALAVIALDQWPPPSQWSDPDTFLEPLDLSAVTALLPAPTPAPRLRRVRTLLLVALTVPALAAPGLLYGRYLQVNPEELPALYEQPVLVSGSFLDGLVLTDDGTLMTWNGGVQRKHRLCSDRECETTRVLPSLPEDARTSARGAALPDGSWAVPQWVEDPSQSEDDDNEPLELKLTRCTAQDCTDPYETPTMATIDDLFEDAVALTASGQKILIAAATDTGDRDREIDSLRLLRCAGVPCDDPRTLAEIKLPKDYVPGIEPIGLATRPGGVPVLAYENSTTGAITLLSCDDPNCRNPVTRHPVAPATFANAAEEERLSPARYDSGVELVIPADDRPVMVYRDIKTEVTRLLRCRTPDCAAVDARTLTGPVSSDVADLALGSDGLPLVATFDVPRRRAILIFCDVADCSRRDTVDLGIYSTRDPGVLDLAVLRDGRPRIAWDYRLVTGYEHNDGSFLLTCRDARCGA